MSVRFLLDENLRGPLGQLIDRHNRIGTHPLTVDRVGVPPAPPVSTADPDLLAWAADHDAVLVTHDKASMTNHISDHLAAGGRLAGVFLVRNGAAWAGVLDYLVLAHYAADPAEFRDTFRYIP